MKTNDELKRDLRVAQAKLRAAKCSCGGKHDPFWVPCDRTTAEMERDDVLAAMGVITY